MNRIDGPFNPKCKKLHLRAYLLGTISDAEIEKNDGNSQLVKIRQPPKGIAHRVLKVFASYIFLGFSFSIHSKIQENTEELSVVPFSGQFY